MLSAWSWNSTTETHLPWIVSNILFQWFHISGSVKKMVQYTFRSSTSAQRLKLGSYITSVLILVVLTAIQGGQIVYKYLQEPTYITSKYNRWSQLLFKPALPSEFLMNSDNVCTKMSSWNIAKLLRYSLINMRQLQILIISAKTWHRIVCWFSWISLFLRSSCMAWS